MSTYRELVYLVLDEIKLASDDSYFTEDHVLFLLNKYRTFVLKKTYADVKKDISSSNYQTITLNLKQIDSVPGLSCEGSYLRSEEEIPNLLNIGNPSVYTTDYYKGNIVYVSRERMKYVGYNKYLQNIIYCSIGPDNYLYLVSNNPQYEYLESVKFTGIFEDVTKLLENDGSDIMDMLFPLEESLIPSIIELVVKELLGAAYRPEDDINNAKDDLSDIITYIRRNMKSNLTKALEGES